MQFAAGQQTGRRRPVGGEGGHQSRGVGGVHRQHERDAVDESVPSGKSSLPARDR
ncbi:hypothetical protein [Streptomyces sp. NPDC020742]|uniref:hypothetical protein n=1 Tax=Streptomyces sp. NPDC020742 TaxID=3154897 RepID=UPI00340E7E6C